MHHTSGGGCKVITSTKSSFTYKLSSHHQHLHHHHNFIITASSSSSSSSSRLVDVSKTVLPRGCFMKNHHLLYWSAFSCTSITQKYKDTKEQRYCSQILGKSAQASADLGEVCSALASKSLLSQPLIVACAWVCKDGDFHSCSCAI